MKKALALIVFGLTACQADDAKNFIEALRKSNIGIKNEKYQNPDEDASLPQRVGNFVKRMSSGVANGLSGRQTHKCAIDGQTVKSIDLSSDKADLFQKLCIDHGGKILDPSGVKEFGKRLGSGIKGQAKEAVMEAVEEVFEPSQEKPLAIKAGKKLAITEGKNSAQALSRTFLNSYNKIDEVSQQDESFNQSSSDDDYNDEDDSNESEDSGIE